MGTVSLVVPPLTPFTTDQRIDWDALHRQIDYIIDVCGATHIVAAGVEAQEYQCLDLPMRRELIRHTIAATAQRVPVIVGISHPSLAISVELAQLAHDLGAASVQALAPLRPFGGAPNDADMVRYFEILGAEVALPIVLYLNPGPGADVSVAGTCALARLPRIVMVKESSRDLARVSRLIVEIDVAGHARYLTTIQMLLITLILGGSGATMPPPAAAIARQVIDAWAGGEHDRAASLQLQFALFPARWMHRGLTATMKAAMALIGQPVGDVVAPWQGLNEAEKADLARLLAETVLGQQLLATA